jgi:hypothetical protein
MNKIDLQQMYDSGYRWATRKGYLFQIVSIKGNTAGIQLNGNPHYPIYYVTLRKDFYLDFKGVRVSANSWRLSNRSS